MGRFIESHQREQLVFYCECGSTLKICTLSEEELTVIEEIWSLFDGGHQPVTSYEAMRIREMARRRRKAG